MPAPESQKRLIRYDVGFGIADDAAASLAMEIHWPRGGPVLPWVWVCLPGGGMSRQFYDLAGSDGEFSFARQMAARGFASVLIDPPGIGDSDRPEDAYALIPERLATILVRAVGRLREDLVAGRVDAALPPMPGLRTIGLGHSMGALLTVLQQCHESSHDAVALLGFGLGGLPEYLPPEVRALAADRQAVRARLVAMARQMFAQPYPDVRSSGEGSLYAAERAEPAAVEALAAARDQMLPVPALMAMLPGNVAPEAAQLDVPVYLAVGEHDLVAPTADAQADFPASPAIEQQLLAGAGHSFFLFPARTRLFDGLAEWGRGLATME